MKMKKVAAMGMAAVTALSMLAGCGSSGGSSSSSSAEKTAESGSAQATSDSGEAEDIVFAIPLSKTVDMSPIEDEVNKITENKLNVHVKIEGISMANYSNQVGLMMSGGEQIDIVSWIGTYSSLIAKKQLMPMTDLIDQYGADAKEVLGEELLKSTTSNGDLYGLPVNNGKAAVLNLVIRKDLVEELNLPVDQLTQAADFDGYCKNLDLITEMYAKIHEAHPEMACVVPSQTNPNGFMITGVPFVDGLNDSLGVLMPGEDSKLENIYATSEFEKLCEYAYDWNQSGYVLEDATTTQETNNTYMQNNRAATFFITGEEGQAEQITTATGVDVESIKLVEPYITTASVNGIGFGISSTSKHPEAAMKFLNEMYSNADLVNLLDWGIEGVHYEVQDDGTVDFPEGVDASNTTYGLNMDWFFGNQFLSKIWGKGRDTTIYERLEANNKNAQFTPVMGFSYNSEPVSTEIAAISNVTNQYLPGLQCGSLNPSETIPEFLQALDDAGINVVIEEKQKQLDEWKANNQ